MTGRTEKHQGSATCRFGLARTLISEMPSCLLYFVFGIFSFIVQIAKLHFSAIILQNSHPVLIHLLYFSVMPSFFFFNQGQLM